MSTLDTSTEVAAPATAPTDEHAAAVAAAREMLVTPPAGEGEGEGEGEGDETAPALPDAAAASEAAAAEAKGKASKVREAQRYARQARREREQAVTERAALAKEREELTTWRAEQKKLTEDLRRNPLRVIAEQLKVTPEQLIANLADGKVAEVSPHVQAQIDELRAELERERTDRTERERKASEDAHAGRLETGIRQDVAFIAGVAAREDATTYPHFASLPAGERDWRARAMVHRALDLIRRDGVEIGRREILEALDEEAKGVYQSFVASKWLVMGQGQPGSGGDAPGEPPQKSRARLPSNRDGAQPAPRGPLTDEQMRANAITAVRELFAGEKRRA